MFDLSLGAPNGNDGELSPIEKRLQKTCLCVGDDGVGIDEGDKSRQGTLSVDRSGGALLGVSRRYGCSNDTRLRGILKKGPVPVKTVRFNPCTRVTDKASSGCLNSSIGANNIITGPEEGIGAGMWKNRKLRSRKIPLRKKQLSAAAERANDKERSG